jgi:excisionase family DNA binding protein
MTVNPDRRGKFLMAKKKTEPQKEKLYTVDEMCKLLQIDRRNLVEWVQYRRIPYVLVNGESVRFKLSDIATWVKHKNKPRDSFHLS